MKYHINNYLLPLIIAMTLILSGCGINSPAGSGGGLMPGATGTAASQPNQITAPHVPNQILVKVKNIANAQQVAAAVGGSITGTISSMGVVRITLSGLSVTSAIGKLRGNPDVIYAEPNYTVQSSYLPNDTLYNQQWGPQKIGTETALNTTQGATVTVAVLDTGIDGTHPDLAGQLIAGYDYINNIPLTGAENSDDVGHGTHVSGTVAANTNNALGVAGVAPLAKIMPVKVLGVGGGANFGIAQGIVYATLNGAKVINMSLGGQGYSQVMQDAVTKAYLAGVTVVVSMGNNGCNRIQYPAACQGVIAVGAANPYDAVASFSTTGNHISVVAPGVKVLSCVPAFVSPSGYTSWDGTSMATPHVSGIAALIIATHPGITPAQLRSQLEATATHPGVFSPNDGYGRVDAIGAIGALAPNKYGDVMVTVTSQAGVPIAGANILLRTPARDYTTLSDINGKGYMLDIPAGAGYSLYVNGIAMTAAQNQVVNVTAGQTTNAAYTFTANSGGQLYITGTYITAMDILTNLITSASPFSISYGIAVVPATNKLYVTNQLTDTLDIVDTGTYQVVSTVRVGMAPYKVAVNPAASRAYTTNYFSDNVSVIDLQTNTVIATIPTGSAPVGIVLNTVTNRAYIANWLSNTVSVIDTLTNTVIATVPTGLRPVSIAIHPAVNKLFVSNSNGKNISVINTLTNTVAAAIPVKLGRLAGITVNPATNTVYVYSPASNAVSVINALTNASIAIIATPADTTTFYESDIVVNPATSRLYVPNDGAKTITVIDTLTNTIFATAGPFMSVSGFALAP